MTIKNAAPRVTVNAFGDDLLGAADAVEIARRVAASEVRALDVVEAAIARAERVNPQLNAIATPLFDAARQQAKMPPAGVFGGVPTFVKDSDAVAGSPVLFGSAALPDTPASKSSPLVEQFLAAGVINLGKSNTPELGLTATTEALRFGPTHNPWNPSFSPGGSSGGSAALVAAGVVPIAHGNDGAGSIRIPASCCGLVGLKPSRGRVADVEGSALLPVRILCQGILSRSVRDTAAFLHAAEGYRANRKLPVVGAVDRPGRRLRIGFFVNLAGCPPTHPDCVAAASAAAKLCESLGHSVVEVVPPCYERFRADFFLLWAAMAFAITRFGKQLIHPQFDRGKTEPFTEGLARHCRANLHRLPGAIRRLRRYAHQVEDGFEQYDVLLCPTMATPPPPLGFLGTELPFETVLARLEQFIPFTPVQNVSGGPAISLPLARNQDGLPIGVQFAARLGDERTLLELALELEAAAPWPAC